MKAVHLIRYSLLTGVCAGLLTGCSWLEDWPPKGSEMARKSAPKPPESKVMEGGDSAWPDDSAADIGEQAAFSSSKGVVTDAASEQRIAKLESSLQQIQNDLQLMMPAITRLAEAQGDIQNNLANIEPAAGGGLAPPNDSIAPGHRVGQPTPIAAAAMAAPQNTVKPSAAPQPGSVAWYEQQEKQKRMGGQMQPVQTQTAQAQPVQMQQQPQMQQAAYQQPQGSYQQQPRQQVYQPASQQQYQQPYQPPAQYQPQYQPVSQPVYQQPAQVQAQGSGYGGVSSAYVSNVRFGEHSDKTRLVFDTSGKVAFGYDIDNNERILIINLPNTGWNAAREMMISNSPIVSSYRILSDNAGGHQVVMQLKQPAQVLWAQALEPGGPQGHRVVLDLAAL